MPGIRRFWIVVVLAGVGVLKGPATVAAADEDPDTPRDPAASEASPATPATSVETSAASDATRVTSPVKTEPGEAGALAVPDLEPDLERIDVFEPDWAESPVWEQAPDETDPPPVEDEAAAVEPDMEAAEADVAAGVPELDTPDSDSLVDLEPFPSVPDQEALRVFVESEPAALGPLSIGSPDGGLLFNPVAMPEGELWKVRNPHETFATAETIEFITSAIEAVEARHPGSPRLVIGDISRPDGGRLNRHRSHQAGRDVDIGFYFRSGEAADLERPGRDELDVPRTWTFVRALVTDTDIQRIFVDRAVQRVLYAHALAEGEDPEWLDDIFGRRTDGKDAIIQHERRHQDHLHARFYNRSAQELGRVAYPLLVQARLVPGPTVTHRVRTGETLSHLARRYGASVTAIRAANGLRGSGLRAGRSYVIPVRKAPVLSDPVVVPPRRLPPATQATEEERPADGGGSLP